MRREVLSAFKRLHRARQVVFKDDKNALAQGRLLINDNFRKNKNVEEKEEIKKLVQLALDAEKELRTNVIQAVQKEDGIFELRIRDEVTKLENVSFNPYALPPDVTRKNEFQCRGGTKANRKSAPNKSEESDKKENSHLI